MTEESTGTPGGEVRRGGAAATRTFEAPTRPEAEALAGTTIAAFTAAGWQVDDELWIPGDRRPGLGESLVLSPASENLLEANGTLRVTFVNPDPNAALPEVAPSVRRPDEWEQLGGTRYRRLAPRWVISAVVFLIGLVVILSVAGGLGGSNPTIGPDGSCPVGYAPAYASGPNGTLMPIGCQRLTGP